MGAKTGNPRGRPKGAKNKRTEERMQAMDEVAAQIRASIPDAFDGDSHALLMAVYKDPLHDIDLRVDCAKAAIGYEKARLSSIEAKTESTVEQTLTVKQDAADEIDRRIARIAERGAAEEGSKRH